VQSGIRPAGKGVGASASGEAEKPAQRAIPSPQTPSRRVFAPQSYDQSAMARRPWMGQQKRMMARTPPWAIAAGVAGVVIVVVLIAWIFLHNYRKPTVASTSGVDLGSRRSNSSYSLERGSSQTLTPGDAHLLPAPGSILQRAPTPLGPGPGPDPGEVQTDAPGKVYGPSEVTRDAKLLYVIIASTPEADVAKRNAEFLAQNGVDVSIELLKGPHGNSSLFTLISVKGFPTHTEADAYKKRIVMIGHKTPDFVKTRKAWDDAYATHVKSLATPSK
jgi:hypothetical protein